MTQAVSTHERRPLRGSGPRNEKRDREQRTALGQRLVAKSKEQGPTSKKTKETFAGYSVVRAVSSDMKRKAEESLEAYEVCLSPGAASIMEWLARRSGQSPVEYLERVVVDYLKDILGQLDNKESEDLLSLGVRKEADRGEWWPGTVSVVEN
ncbi:MAG: hypothetical protein ABSB29_01160 [Nitrososphaerales archaeon]|jgi:hypothetical protein